MTEVSGPFGLNHTNVKSWAVLSLLALAISALAYQLAYGQHGLMVYFDLENEIVQARMEERTITNERLQQEKRVSLLDPEQVSLDMLEEQARIVLGFTRPNEREYPTRYFTPGSRSD